MPRSNNLVAIAPGLLRRLIERIGFNSGKDAKPCELPLEARHPDSPDHLVRGISRVAQWLAVLRFETCWSVPVSGRLLPVCAAIRSPLCPSHLSRSANAPPIQCLKVSTHHQKKADSTPKSRVGQKVGQNSGSTKNHQT